MAPTPKRRSTLREVVSLTERLRFAKVQLALRGRDDDFTWHTIGDPGEPAFGSGWSHADGTYPLGFARHSSDGTVWFRGAAKASDPHPITAFTLPDGFLPAFEIDFAMLAIDDFGQGIGSGAIVPNGDVDLFVPGNHSLVSLEGLAFVYADDPSTV